MSRFGNSLQKLFALATVALLALGCAGPVTGTHRTDGGTSPGGGGGGGGDDGLTVTPASSSVSMAAGTSYQEVITLDGSTASSFTVTASAPANLSGLHISFAQVPDSNNKYYLSLTTPSPATLGTYSFVVHATDGTLSGSATITLTLRAPAAVLLVDHDASENNNDPTQPPSAQDLFYAAQLTAKGVAFDTFRVSADAISSPVTQSLLANYHTIVWYTADTYGPSSPALSGAEEILLRDGWFTTDGDRRLEIFSDSLMYELRAINSSLAWSTPTADPFITNVLGLHGASVDVENHHTATVSGVSGQTTAGMTLSIATDQPTSSYFDPMNPDHATTLLTLVDSGCDSGSPPSDIGSCVWPSAISNTFTAGASTGTKRIVALTFPFENGVDVGANTRSAVFAALWTNLTE